MNEKKKDLFSKQELKAGKEIYNAMIAAYKAGNFILAKNYLDVLNQLERQALKRY